MEKCQDSICCHPVKYSLRNGRDPGWPEAGIGQELQFNIPPLNSGIIFFSPEVFKLDFSHEILYTNKILGISPRSKRSSPGWPHTKHCLPACPWLTSPCFYPFPPPGNLSQLCGTWVFVRSSKDALKPYFSETSTTCSSARSKEFRESQFSHTRATGSCILIPRHPVSTSLDALHPPSWWASPTYLPATAGSLGVLTLGKRVLTLDPWWLLAHREPLGLWLAALGARRALGTLVVLGAWRALYRYSLMNACVLHRMCDFTSVIPSSLSYLNWVMCVTQDNNPRLVILSVIPTPVSLKKFFESGTSLVV